MLPRIIDRYVIREVIPPFLLALLVFTFILIIPFIIDLAETMIAKGVPGRRSSGWRSRSCPRRWHLPFPWRC